MTDFSQKNSFTNRNDCINNQKKIYDDRYRGTELQNWKYYPLDFLDWRIHKIWKYLPINISILDVGCGLGSLILRQNPQKSFSYFGVDISHEGLKKANDVIKNKYDTCWFTLGSALEIPYKNCCFDAIFLVSVLEHVPDPQQTIKECVRLLKQNGFLIIYTPNPNDFFAMDGILRFLIPRYYAKRNNKVGHDYDRFISPKSMRDILQGSDIKIKQFYYTDTFFEWLWVNTVWPIVVSLGRNQLMSGKNQFKSNLRKKTEINRSFFRNAIWFYNKIIFPLVRLFCIPDRILNLTKQSGGYLIFAQKGVDS